MVSKTKVKLFLPLLLTFLGYCGDGKTESSDKWLTTSDLQNLVAPAGVSASCQSSGKIKVTWNASYETIATHLQIFRKAVAAEDEFVKIDEVVVDAGIYSNTVPNNVYYKYQVKAVVRDEDGNLQYVSPDSSPQTNQVKATIGCSIDIDTGNQTNTPVSAG